MGNDLTEALLQVIEKTNEITKDPATAEKLKKMVKEDIEALKSECGPRNQLHSSKISDNNKKVLVKLFKPAKH